MDDTIPPFNVIIVHEDSVAGLHATNVLQKLAAQLETKLGVDVNPWEICSHVWQFEWLLDPQLCEQAVAESIKADMIIISAENNTELPSCVRSWIESVLPHKQGTTTALVALLGGPNQASSAALPSARYLRQLALQYGVDFLCNADSPSTQRETTLAPVLRPFGDDPAFVEEVVPLQGGRHGWGLND